MGPENEYVSETGEEEEEEEEEVSAQLLTSTAKQVGDGLLRLVLILPAKAPQAKVTSVAASSNLVCMLNVPVCDHTRYFGKASEEPSTSVKPRRRRRWTEVHVCNKDHIMMMMMQ